MWPKDLLRPRSTAAAIPNTVVVLALRGPPIIRRGARLLGRIKAVLSASKIRLPAQLP
jgi:hypothetical protein